MSTPTASLPPAARTAMRRLELALTPSIPAVVIRAVTQYETAAVHAKELAAVAASGQMTDLDADSLAATEDLMAASKDTLAAADWLATGYLRTSARYGEYEAWLTHGRLLADRLGLAGDAHAKRQQLPGAARAVAAVVDQMHLGEQS
ncbi:hypothetical protein ABZ876_08270 [Streptomyces sp. NPDC046931]|uniref:hypothetical protein n=1 Tax=Streptomyces sp. NPDC046931 TaxID=3154806 RepID=UPI0033CA1105